MTQLVKQLGYRSRGVGIIGVCSLWNNEAGTTNTYQGKRKVKRAAKHWYDCKKNEVGLQAGKEAYSKSIVLTRRFSSSAK
jgi:hypothetical protein